MSWPSTWAYLAKYFSKKTFLYVTKNILQHQQFFESFLELFRNMMSQQKNLHSAISACGFCLNFVNWEMLKQIDKNVLNLS